MKNILITGGAGYIGSHVCELLSRSHYKPISFDNLSTGYSQSTKWGPLHIGDILNPDDLDLVFSKYNFDAVIHLAALTYPRESIESPKKYLETNITGTHNVLNQMDRFGVKKFIFSSSCSIYDLNAKSPLREDSSINPVTPYGKSKYEIEKYLEGLHKTNSISSIILRYFNSAGARHDEGIGEKLSHTKRLIPKIIDNIYNSKPIWIYGKNHQTHDGTPERDYVHVSDIAQAHVNALNLLESNNCILKRFNIGLGQPQSVGSIIQICESITKKKAIIKYAPANSYEASSLYTCTKKSNDELNWYPKNRSIREIVNSTHVHYLNQRKDT